MPTKIDERKLQEWKTRLPKRLHLFLDNFFLTCEQFDPFENYLNYVNDVRLYGLDIPAYRDNEAQLYEAFYDITGYNPGRR